MELRQLEYVLAVIDHGSFTAGAEAVGVAQPSLSEGIRKLESELGVQFFHRIGRGVSLTQAGHALEGPARRLLRDRAQVLEAVDSVRALDAGTLDVVALPTLAVDPLAGLVGRFRRAHPGIAVHIFEPNDVDAIDAVDAMVADGRAEIGLAELPSGRDDLVTIKLARQKIVAVCPPGTLLRSAGRLPVAALKSMPLVAPPRGASTRDLLDRALASAAVEAKIAVETAHREAIGPLVLGGAE